MHPQHPTLLTWDFANVVSERGVSTAVGIPSDPTLISGFISQTGGGPAEVFGDGVGTVFLTRHLGSNEVFMWFTVTRQVNVGAITLRHYHNHTPGFPTHPAYRVQLQLDAGNGYENCGAPLHLSPENFGHFSDFSIGRVLPPGTYKLRWHPQGLQNGARDTGSEFFAFKAVTLHGHIHEPAGSNPPQWFAGYAQPETLAEASRPAPAVESVDAPSAAPTAEPPCALGSHVNIEIGGVTVDRLKVMESKFPGTCVRTGRAFAAGATIGFKHRTALTDEQRAAIFGAAKPAHVVVLLNAPDGDHAPDGVDE